MYKFVRLINSSGLPFSLSRFSMFPSIEKNALWYLGGKSYSFYAKILIHCGIDDFSQYCWFYPLMQNSNFFDIFLSFQKLVENWLARKIKYFQSNGGGEFMINILSRIFMNVAYNNSLVQVRQRKNGVVEMKHQYVVELELVALFEASMPLNYRVEAFTTMNYLINWLP